jgi:uncharacterized protein YbjT (DUF2867 family)
LILVTGATGFTGSFVVERLIAKGFDFACFVRPTSDTTSLKLRGIDIRVGTLDDYESLKCPPLSRHKFDIYPNTSFL